MPILDVAASRLGHELEGLSRDDGPRLAVLLQKLQLEVAREPQNLIAAAALNKALGMAGYVAEAHALAWRVYEQMQRLPAVSAELQITVGAGLAEAGRVTEAKRCFELVLARGHFGILDALRLNMMGLAVRFGELAWLENLLPGHPAAGFLRFHNLDVSWPIQQAAVETLLGSHVSTFGASFEDFRDGTERLVLDYFTDTTDPVRVGEMEEAVWDALERVYQMHPLGPGAVLGRAIINVHGILVPLPKEEP